MLFRSSAARPSAKGAYGFLDKRTAAMSVASSIDPQSTKPAAEPVAEAAPVAEEPVVEETVEPSAEGAVETEDVPAEPASEAAPEETAEVPEEAK